MLSDELTDFSTCLCSLLAITTSNRSSPATVHREFTFIDRRPTNFRQFRRIDSSRNYRSYVRKARRVIGFDTRRLDQPQKQILAGIRTFLPLFGLNTQVPLRNSLIIRAVVVFSRSDSRSSSKETDNLEKNNAG